MNNQKNIPLLGLEDEYGEWTLPTRKKWVPPTKKFKKWGTNLPEPRKQWQRNSNNKQRDSNNRKGGKR